MAHPDREHQKHDVLAILDEIGLAPDTPIIEVQNKIDLLDDEERTRLATLATGSDQFVTLSAQTGENCDTLLAVIDSHLRAARETCEFKIPSHDGSAIAWLHEHGEIINRHDAEGMTTIEVALFPADARRFEKRQVESRLLAAD
jgi:GTP-binding protein HflX